MEIIYASSGIAAGIVIAFLIARYFYSKDRRTLQTRADELTVEINTLETGLKVEREKNRSLSENYNAADRKLSEKEQSVIELNRRLAEKNANIAHLDERLREQKTEVLQLQEKLDAAFKNLANEILEEKSRRFAEQNKTNLAEILNPLNEKIGEFENRVRETYDKESKERFSLQNEIKNLMEMNHKISAEANNLANALKGQSKTRGLWGEMVLESILDKSGLVKNREYRVQPSYENENGRKLRPDVVVEFPGDRSVIIDSKVSLNAYEKYCSAESETQRKTRLRDHVQSVRRHIDELSAKKYNDIPDIKNPDFVIMFMPIEPAYLLAIQTDPEMWRHAYDRRTLLIGPTNLIVVLKMIDTLWKQEYQNRNAEEIARQSGALYDKFVGFIEELSEMGRKLKAVRNHYETSMKRLYSGKGNLVKRAENIKEMGAKTNKSMPKWLDRVVDEEE